MTTKMPSARGATTLLLPFLAILAGCGSATKTVTTTVAPAAPTATQVKEKAAEQAAERRAAAAQAIKEAREKRAEEDKEKQERAHQAAERRVTEAREHSEHEAERQKEKEREYPAEVQHNVIVGCTAHEATESQCRCVLKKMEVHLTVEQVLAIEQGMRGGVPEPPEFTKWAEECRGE
jgi:hypothetical protein